ANFFRFLSTETSDVIDRLQVLQRCDRRTDHVDRRTASDALGEDIADAGQFQHRADRTAGDNTGTFSCRTQEYFACTVCSSDLMRDRRTDYRYSEQVFLGIFLSFADRVRNFVCLSGSEAYTAFFVTDYH